MTNFLINLRSLTFDEKTNIYNRIDGWAFIITRYFANNELSGFVVSWDRHADEFIKLAESIPKCDYKDVTGWDLGSDRIDHAFIAAFDV